MLRNKFMRQSPDTFFFLKSNKKSPCLDEGVRSKGGGCGKKTHIGTSAKGIVMGIPTIHHSILRLCSPSRSLPILLTASSA